jgi:hypothetical protein
MELLTTTINSNGNEATRDWNQHKCASHVKSIRDLAVNEGAFKDAVHNDRPNQYVAFIEDNLLGCAK